MDIISQSIDNPHIGAAEKIINKIALKIKSKETKYIITIAGESGSGKTETGKALADKLLKAGLFARVLNQDNYFVLPPSLNDARRKSDPAWLGPHVEVNMGLLEQNITDAIKGKHEIVVPFIDYYSTIIEKQRIDITGIKVLIIEGTYVSLLRQVDTRIFITSDYRDTLPYRTKRNRGNEINDPFVENILISEHKIIAGHRFLADFIIDKDYSVTCI